jgi:group I intron endonuclease
MKRRTVTRWYGFLVHPNNIPLPRSGVYGIENTVTEEWYIGISRSLSKRIRDHCTPSPSRISAAIAQYGVQEFRAVPLFYTTQPSDHATLSLVETALIRQFNSIDSGYNIIEWDADQHLRYGKAHSAAVKAGHARPDVKKRVTEFNQQSNQQPDIRKKLSISVRAAYNDPAVRVRISNKVTESWQRPETRSAHLAARATASFKAKVVAVMQSDEVVAKRLAVFRKPAHRAKVGKWLNTPEAIEKRNATLRTEEVQSRKSASQRIAFADPAFKERQRVIMAEIHSRPEVSAKRKASVAASWERRRAMYGPSGRPRKAD